MNSYFFKMTNEEKNNILDQHKTVYDGYVTQYVKPNQQPPDEFYEKLAKAAGINDNDNSLTAMNKLAALMKDIRNGKIKLK